MDSQATEAVQDISVSDLLNQQADAPAAPTETAQDAANESQVQGNEEGRQEVAAPSLKDRISELGFTDVADDDEAVARLIESHRQSREREQQTQQQFEMLRWQMQQMQQGQQVPAQQQATQQSAPAPWHNPPKSNTQFRQQFIAGRADDGSVQWKANTPPNVIAEHEAEEAYYADWANKLVRDPVNALAGFKAEVLAEAQKQAQQFIEQQARKQQAESFVEQQIREHEDVFYQKDPVTKAIRRDFQGREMLTEAGVRFESILGELEAAGLTDETARWKYALQSYKAQYGDLKQQASDRMAQARTNHAAKVAAAAHIAPRNGQEVNGASNGRRAPSEGLGGRLFSNPDFASSFGF